MEDLRTYSRPTTSMPVRPRPQNYEEEMLLRRLQEQRDGDLARRMQHSDEYDREHDEEREEDHGHGRDRHRDRKRDRNRKRDRDRERDRERERERENPFAPISAPMTPDVEEDEMDFGFPGGKYHPAEDYRRTSMPALSTTAPIAQQPQPYAGYVTEVNRARGPQRSNSMEQRLADRLSENRSGRRSTGPSPPAPVMRPHVIHQRDAATDMGISMAMGAMGRGAIPPPSAYAPLPAMPPPGMMRPNPFGGDAYYDNAYTTAPKSVHDPYYYGGMDGAEAELPSPRRRSRRSGEERERPKSSTLAGLTGYGRGAHRVSEWRNFVVPGFPEQE